MAAADHLGNQFNEPTGDPDAKKALLKQLKGDFPKEARDWIKDDRVTVEAAARVNPHRIDFSEYPDWRASRQLKAVRKIAKKLEKDPGNPAVMADRPGDDKLDTIDGHHHVLAEIDRKKRPKAYIIHVPREHGPWDTMHDKQTNDPRKDDFGKTDKADARD
jgi:hypothetical protein